MFHLSLPLSHRVWSGQVWFVAVDARCAMFLLKMVKGGIDGQLHCQSTQGCPCIGGMGGVE